MKYQHNLYALRALLIAVVVLPCIAVAQVISPLPYTLTNNTIADANQVMANFNAIVNNTNSNAATAGVNANITSIIGLTTPLSPAQGGTSVYTFGTSTGSANAQVIGTPSPSGFQIVTGRRVTFIAGFTNNSTTTFNINSTGTIAVYKNTTSGVSVLSGGEIVAGTIVDAWYDGTRYVLLNASPQSLVPTGTLADFTGVDVPSGWFLANGTVFTRTIQSALFAALNRTFAVTTISGSPSLTVADSSIYQVGWFVGGTNVTCNSTITVIPDATHITMSANAGASGATTLNAGPYGLGDCSATFAIPDFVGRFTAGVDGTLRITSGTCGGAASLGTYCGAQSLTIAAGNLPTLTGITQSTGSNNIMLRNGGANTLYAAGGNVVPQPLDSTLNLFTVSVNIGSANTAISKLPPVGLVYKIIKL